MMTSGGDDRVSRMRKLLRPKRIEGREVLAPQCAAAWRDPPCDYFSSAPPANGCVAVFAEEITVSIFGSFFMARAIDSFVA